MRGFAALCWLLMFAAVPFSAARARQADTSADQRYAAWRSAPFTCHDLVAADAGKDDSTDTTGNYDAIMAWEAEFPKLGEHRDRDTSAELQATVLKWCNDLAASGNTNPALADVVEKAWRMMGF